MGGQSIAFCENVQNKEMLSGVTRRVICNIAVTLWNLQHLKGTFVLVAVDTSLCLVDHPRNARTISTIRRTDKVSN